MKQTAENIHLLWVCLPKEAGLLSKQSDEVKTKIAPSFILMLIASRLANIVWFEWTGSVPDGLFWAKLCLFAAAAWYFYYTKKNLYLGRLAMVLALVVSVEKGAAVLESLPVWRSFFDYGTFYGAFASPVLLKLCAALIVVLFLRALFGSFREVFLCKGDLSVFAEPIPFLNIKKNQIRWGRLALISGLLISLGTIVLTMVTVTGFGALAGADRLVAFFPAVVLLALINSFSEGVIFRSGVLGPLHRVLPKKELLYLGAAFFGIAHYYGAPSGVLGVFMSGVLGWFLCRSMYETSGFFSSWLIHFLQDVAIFSTFVLLIDFG